MSELIIPGSNVDLYCQMSSLGWADEDIIAAHHVYEKTAKLTYMLARSNGRPFIAHLVGTAGGVAWDSRDVLDVCTALAHSAILFAKTPFWIEKIGRREKFLEKIYGEQIWKRLKIINATSDNEVLLNEDKTNPHSKWLVHLMLAHAYEEMQEQLCPIQSMKNLPLKHNDSDLMAKFADKASAINAPMLSLAFQNISKMVPVEPILKLDRKRAFDMRQTLA